MTSSRPDRSLSRQVLAFVLPGIVQITIGNALEPMVFGSSLNMTPIAILGGAHHTAYPLVVCVVCWSLSPLHHH